jgi:hypothetical protein
VSLFPTSTATLNNTIVAKSTSGGDILGTVSGSNNLIDDAASAGGLTGGANGNLVVGGDSPGSRPWLTTAGRPRPWR